MSYIFDNAFEAFVGLEKTAQARWKRELMDANRNIGNVSLDPNNPDDVLIFEREGAFGRKAHKVRGQVHLSEIENAELKAALFNHNDRGIVSRLTLPPSKINRGAHTLKIDSIAPINGYMTVIPSTAVSHTWQPPHGTGDITVPNAMIPDSNAYKRGERAYHKELDRQLVPRNIRRPYDGSDLPDSAYTSNDVVDINRQRANRLIKGNIDQTIFENQIGAGANNSPYVRKRIAENRALRSLLSPKVLPADVPMDVPSKLDLLLMDAKDAVNGFSIDDLAGKATGAIDKAVEGANSAKNSIFARIANLRKKLGK